MTTGVTVWLSPLRSNQALQSALGRALARHALCDLTETPPEQFHFEVSKNGKPHARIASSGSAAPHFSISHTRGWVSVATCKSGRVGIDLEGPRPFPTRLAKRVLARSDLDAVLALPVGERNSAFMRLWVLREACAKVRGEGLSGMLGSIREYGLEEHGVSDGLRWRVAPIDHGLTIAVASEHFTPSLDAVRKPHLIDPSRLRDRTHR